MRTALIATAAFIASACASEGASTSRPLSTEQLRVTLADHTSIAGNTEVYWAPHGLLFAVSSKSYGIGSWSLAEGQVCTDVTWYQNPRPKQSTSSQGGGYVSPSETKRCDPLMASDDGAFSGADISAVASDGTADQSLQPLSFKAGNSLDPSFDRHPSSDVASR